MAATKKTNEKLDERLSSVEKEVDEGCGRHCYGGEYVKTPCSKTSKTVCVGCGTGKFSEGGFARECTPCSKCTDRQFQTATCSTAADTGCTDCTTCPKGMFKKYKCTDKSTKQCVKQTVCGKGTWTAVVGSPWQDNQCKKCTACAKGSFAAKACTATADAVCAKCTAACKEGQLHAPALCHPRTRAVDLRTCARSMRAQHTSVACRASCRPRCGG